MNAVATVPEKRRRSGWGSCSVRVIAASDRRRAWRVGDRAGTISPLDVPEYPLDDGRVLNAGDDAYFAAAVFAGLDIDPETPAFGV